MKQRALDFIWKHQKEADPDVSLLFIYANNF